MPVLPVYDMEWDQPGKKLIVGTHARSIMSFPMDSLIYNDPLSGIDGGLSQDELKIYPNPAQDRIFFELAAKAEKWRILDLQGRVLRKGESAGQRQEVDITALAAGSYWLRVSTGSAVQSKQFVKQ
ncbi:MAG TPA: T9SS type A sorting domain-containing protein [Bacteroidetes bacterium]|nr:T9SS type A sorting domain-containing protein [Bacteroidota bacterium]